MKSKIALLAIIAAVVGAFFYFDLGAYLTLEGFKSRQAALSAAVDANPLRAALIFFAVYVAVAATSFPGAAILTLVGGAIFGFWTGLLLVSFASSVGATLAFLSARFLLRDFVQGKFGDRLKPINEGVDKDGAFYLFALRLVLSLGPKFNLRRDINDVMTLAARHLVWPVSIAQKVQKFLAGRCAEMPAWAGVGKLSPEEFVTRHGVWNGTYDDTTLFYYLDEFCKQNAKDLQEIPANVKSGLEIVPVRWFDQVIELALAGSPTPLLDDESGVAAVAPAAASLPTNAPETVKH